ncbi:multidrug resistance-associated ABC transporter [Pholiota conissans]|uniref:Multidrug resistance-associated ABC transporter n=1 Tax=Pholiota conissans TaxID=109636 RepID=A0A9P5Z6Q2_9AGAR|nr:multidrug resistance-associated ABC transporter [Pholiota conissans]
MRAKGPNHVIGDVLFNDTLAIPFAATLLFASIQTIHGLVNTFKSVWSKSSRLADEDECGPDATIPRGWPHSQVENLGGRPIFLFAVARLAGCIALFIISVATFVTCDKLRSDVPVFRLLTECSELGLAVTFSYSCSLAITSLTVAKWSTRATRYNIALLLVTFGTYAQRDLWPLATYTLEPQDIAEGPILWAKIAILFATAIIIPLFVPRRYIPVNPKDADAMPNSEQTCSIFSLITYSFLDPIIFLRSSTARLRLDQLPPLSDTDYSTNLRERVFSRLDPFKGTHQHLMFGLFRVFWKEFAIIPILMVCEAICLLLSPVAVYHILRYLESSGHTDDNIRPWFWIFCMFLGPIGNALAFQMYCFINIRTFVWIESILIQLLFQHSLRIRMKAGGEDIDRLDTETITNTNQKVSISAAGATRGGKGMRSDNTIGKLNNFVTTDVHNISEARDFFVLLLFAPLQTCLCITYLYQIIGWSVFVGVVAMIALIPVPGYIASLTQKVQRERMKMASHMSCALHSRFHIESVPLAISVIRMIKLFGWEGRIVDRVNRRRIDELACLWKLKVSLSIRNSLINFMPIIGMIVSYATYTVIMKQDLTPSKIFGAMSVFYMLRLQLYRLSLHTNVVIQGKVSLDRVNDFLHNAELLDAFTRTPNADVTSDATVLKDQSAVGFNNAEFSWSLDSKNGSLMPSSRIFRLRIDGELLFKPNCINLIVGPTGSGKTSLLMALLGEMYFVCTSTDSWFNLPRDGGVAYAAQESWIQNDTIRDNILFGNPFDELRYRKVLRQCALEPDLELFEAGDATEVGEKGLTLSGGQKARVTLARALYSPAKIILLDDVFAALDVHTSSWIVEKCFKGDLVKGRTILLVTHNIALATPVAKFIVSIGPDGSIRTQGTEIQDSLEHDAELAAESQRDREAVELANEQYDASNAPKAKAVDGKLVVAEEIAEGHITWKSLKLFVRSLGGDYPLIFYSTWMSTFLLTDWANTFQTWFLGHWGSQYEIHSPSEVNVFYYLGIYTSILCTTILVIALANIFFVYGSMRASRVINKMLVESILGSTLRWLDQTPTARMIARCTQDIRAVDGPIPSSFLTLTQIGTSLFSQIGVIIIFTPVFIAPGAVVAALGFYLGNLYLKAQLPVKRAMSNARSPLLGHFHAAIVGMVSIRAYGAEMAFKDELLKRIDHQSRMVRISYNLNRWIGLRADCIGALFTVSLASYLVYGDRHLGAANTGFALNMCLKFCGAILYWVRTFNDLEVQTNSLERIQGYIDIEHEPKPTKEGKPPASWPTSGDLRVKHLSARYSETGPRVLHDLNFTVKSGERIGVVGRTGSGKSSLTLALLRCILTEGDVYYDGLPTSSINLDSLRSNITIIPQTPELLSGTLRRNLDPFEQHDDATLNNSLRDAGLFALQEEMGEGQITLDSNIASGGANLSVGQRQILALARAMVRGSKLLILDEATSAIDYKTDSVIQATLRHRLPADVTVITVAHRLQTIMDSDKIMVLDAGRIVEFNTPAALLGNKNGALRALIDGSGDKAVLYSMAQGTSAT